MESLGGLLFPLLILLLFIPIFLSGRKQRAQMQQMQQLQASLEVGDVVTTTSGLRGTVVDASYTDTIDLEIAEGVVTTWLRAAVREKVADPTDPVETTDPADTTADDVTPDRPAAPTPVGSDGTPGTPGDSTVTPSDANGSHRS